jgi:Protein of unknown function (DUF1592)/Protein of unknown function (DUF1588)/Protein of unknown function (DUF1587)/Protein of unknown function (DUF1585)/Protein of unknown function (DUF1595)/Planctomycete cytochrome C
MVPTICTAVSVPRSRSVAFAAVCMLLYCSVDRRVSAEDRAAPPRYSEEIQPILEQYCYACHGLGTKKGGVALDAFADVKAALSVPHLWHAVLKNVRSGIMPPADKPQPSAGERRMLEDWIKREALGIDPSDPDPGRVTVRRLNRVEYRNTIRDLLGVDYDTTSEFPPDDTGNGFDNNGDVLTISPLLLEKYLSAANTIITRAVPMVPRIVAERVIPGSSFQKAGGGKDNTGGISLPYYEPSKASSTVKVENEGRYRLILELKASERYVDGQNDLNRCRVLFFADGDELLRRDFSRQNNKPFRFEFDRDWKAGPHALSVEVQPLTPGEKRVRSLSIRIESVTLRGPMDERYWVRPPDYARFFPRQVPTDPAARRLYAREILGRFAERAFRRPVDDATKDRLAALAEAVSARDGQTFEGGVAQAMAAVLTSPRFLFREEEAEPGSSARYPFINEYSLASRLSYFLWSSMPDDVLVRLAADHKLRENLPAQVDRMLADPRSAEFFRNFVGQWLQARDIESVIINTFAVISRDQVPDPEAEKRRARFRELVRKPPEKLSEAEKKELQQARTAFFGSFRRFREFELTGDLRRAMRRETEMYFEHVIRHDEPLVELLDSDYAFLNSRLAKHYGIAGVQGDAIRLVKLPAGSPRGGILTQGTVLAVTSNPDRTSPVKRGLYILENILGSPPAPPPPNIPALEDSGKKVAGRKPTVRESMVLHRSQPSCAACHARMDPLGLALENFNALGRWRDKERTEPVDASGKLISGESFTEIKELKKILVARHRREFYRCLTEKLLTYALGRGLESYDVGAVDTIVEKIEAADGRSSALIAGLIESTPFQKRRRSAKLDANAAGLLSQSAGRSTEPVKKGADHDH